MVANGPSTVCLRFRMAPVKLRSRLFTALP